MAPDAILEITGLTVTFGVAPALRGVSLQVMPGEAVSVLGANGAGKTTLLRAIMRRVPVVASAVRVGGADMRQASTEQLVRQGVALCPEGRQLFPAMSVEDNLLLGAYGTPARVARQRLEQALDRVAWLRPRRRQMAGGFSGGEQQMVAICRALMSAPRLLLLDEPSSGLSPIAIAQVRDMLLAVRGQGMALLLVEQNVKLATELTTRCYLLNRGTIESEGATADLVEDPGLADAYLGGQSVREREV